ncbi:hypothetical protein [Sporosarcina aquimarina]|uniref:Membrane protein NfeD2 N-terminal transmembrane domain-containing protein n=1 Tax=Sporosarcina aquimarina TaxID=114975 RepID=A0ABU4FZK7_9BACL|nr:hypothetical protein [Sporosarcina aquimarina]MDW0110081.1 hypothetical protein [Sporosarcina aquimarina]
MELFGMTISELYLPILIIAGIATLLYLFFSDLTDGAGDAFPLLDPAVILPFITLTATWGYVLELATNLSSVFVLVISLAAAGILDFLLYFFILLPLKSAEVSIAYTDESLAGKVAKVIVPIPEDGFGEIVIETVNGVLSKRASGYDNVPIDYGKEVLIIEVVTGTFIVKEYEPFRFK